MIWAASQLPVLIVSSPSFCFSCCDINSSAVLYIHNTTAPGSHIEMLVGNIMARQRDRTESGGWGLGSYNRTAQSNFLLFRPPSTSTSSLKLIYLCPTQTSFIFHGYSLFLVFVSHQVPRPSWSYTRVINAFRSVCDTHRHIRCSSTSPHFSAHFLTIPWFIYFSLLTSPRSHVAASQQAAGFTEEGNPLWYPDICLYPGLLEFSFIFFISAQLVFFYFCCHNNWKECCFRRLVCFITVLLGTASLQFFCLVLKQRICRLEIPRATHLQSFSPRPLQLDI